MDEFGRKWFQTCEQEKPLLDVNHLERVTELTRRVSNLQAGKAPFRRRGSTGSHRPRAGFQTCKQEKPLLDLDGLASIALRLRFQTCKQEKPLLDRWKESPGLVWHKPCFKPASRKSPF